MRITKAIIKKEIEKLFITCDNVYVAVDSYEVKVSIWGMHGENPEDKLKEIIKILQIIDSTNLIESGWEVWRNQGCYDDTEDITMNFRINKEKIKLCLKKETVSN